MCTSKLKRIRFIGSPGAAGNLAYDIFKLNVWSGQSAMTASYDTGDLLSTDAHFSSPAVSPYGVSPVSFDGITYESKSNLLSSASSFSVPANTTFHVGISAMIYPSRAPWGIQESSIGCTQSDWFLASYIQPGGVPLTSYPGFTTGCMAYELVLSSD